MKLLILAAGKGERLGPLTKSIPKSLLPVRRGTTLLGMQLAHARRCGIKDVVIVIGYRGAQIEEHLAELDDGARTLFNPFYDVSNNLVSAWLARNEMHDETILLNGDVVFHPDVMRRLLQAGNAPVNLVVDRKPDYDDDDMKVTIADGRVVAVSKTIPLERVDAESIGMMRFSREGAASFTATLEQMVRDPANRDVFYLAAIQRMAAKGEVGFVECAPDEWAEIDFHPDLDFVNANIRRFEARVSSWPE